MSVDRLDDEQKAAVLAAGAGLAGVLMHYVRNNWTPFSFITGLFFEFAYVFMFRMLIPFVFSSLFISITGYIVNLARGADKFSASRAGLLLLALGVACYVIFGLSDGVLLIISGLLFVFRLLLRLI